MSSFLAFVVGLHFAWSFPSLPLCISDCFCVPPSPRPITRATSSPLPSKPCFFPLGRQMVKSRRPPLPSQSSLSPPLASLTLPPLHRKPSKPSAPIMSPLKRSLLLPVDLSGLSMDPKSPCDTADSSYCDGVEGKAPSRPQAISNTVTEQSPLSAKEATSEAGSNEAAGQDLAAEAERQVSDCGRQRLQDHWIQMGGKVIIPDTWGREQHLQDWVSFGLVEDALRPAGLMSARSALMSECQRRGNEAVRSTTPALSADVEVSYG